MTVALLLSSRPLALPNLTDALRSSSVSLASGPIESVALDDAERAGVKELMGVLGVEHAICVWQSDAAVYDPGFFDEVTDARASLVGELCTCLDPGARGFLVLMYEWEGVESTRLLAGAVGDLRNFLCTLGGWPPHRLSHGRGGYHQEIHTTLVFELVSD